MERLSSELKSISNFELHERTLLVARKEQQTTLELLYLLHEASERKLYAEQGYSSLWDYVTRALGYSETQTQERISAMRLMFRTEDSRQAVESGALSLTQAAMTERFIRAEEKEKKVPVSRADIQTLLHQVQGKSKRETEKVFLSLRPQELPKEKIRQVTETDSELRFSISEETRKQMVRFWELKGRGSVSELFSACLAFYLEKKDPVQTSAVKSPLPAKVERSKSNTKKQSRYIAAQVKRTVQTRSEGRCEYVDPETNRKCESKYLLQFDHIHPYARGGTSELSNIRHLCAVHNGYLAEKVFGLRAFAREETEPYGWVAFISPQCSVVGVEL